jgi:prepilin-type N-terminal cleavage/methylation domain-containing protein
MRRSSNNGFTLLELLIVITILAFMTTLVGVNLHGRERTDLESVARTLLTDLRYVRSRATVDERDIAGSRARIVFYPDGSSSGGEIHLSNNGRELEVATSWLNGYVTLR